jgi:phosphoesterase RecJ-like protein
VRGVEVAAVLREQENGRIVRIGLRSNSPAVDVSRVAQRFGGGGHVRAAACTIPQALDEAERTVVAALADALEQTKETT